MRNWYDVPKWYEYCTGMFDCIEYTSEGVGPYDTREEALDELEVIFKREVDRVIEEYKRGRENWNGFLYEMSESTNQKDSAEEDKESYLDIGF